MPLARELWDCHTHIFGPWNEYPLAERPTYVPDEAPFPALEALHAECGITRGVIVQATPYGDDHRALLAALSASKGAYRGIAVITEHTPDESLTQMHQHGVRGIRLGMMKHPACRMFRVWASCWRASSLMAGTRWSMRSWRCACHRARPASV